MSGSIKLHPTKGINPILTFCERCHENNAIIIAGAAITAAYKGACPDCGTMVYCTSNNAKNTPREQEVQCPCGTYLRCQQISDREPIPYGLCQKCQDELESFKQIVSDGGVYFKCKNCNANGVIKADSTLAIKVREITKIAPPDPVGIEFESCDQHEFNKPDESEPIKND